MTFDDDVRALLDGKNFATVATLNPDGSPQTSVVWIGVRDDAVVFSTRGELRKTRNLQRDPRIGLTVFDLANPYRTVNISGVAELIEDPDRTLPRELSQKYLGEDPPPESPDVVRFVVRITPQKITGRALR